LGGHGQSWGGSPLVNFLRKMPIAQVQEKVFWEESLKGLLPPVDWLVGPAGVV